MNFDLTIIYTGPRSILCWEIFHGQPITSLYRTIMELRAKVLFGNSVVVIRFVPQYSLRVFYQNYHIYTEDIESRWSTNSCAFVEYIYSECHTKKNLNRYSLIHNLLGDSLHYCTQNIWKFNEHYNKATFDSPRYEITHWCVTSKLPMYVGLQTVNGNVLYNTSFKSCHGDVMWNTFRELFQCYRCLNKILTFVQIPVSYTYWAWHSLEIVIPSLVHTGEYSAVHPQSTTEIAKKGISQNLH